MTTLEIRWPDAGEEQVRSARGKLSVASEGLRRMPFEERVRRVSQILEHWTRVDSPWRRELAASLAAADSPFDASTLAEGLDSGLRAWDPDTLEECAHREIGSIISSGRIRLAPFETVSILTGGSIPMPTISSALFAFITGSPVLLRETASDPVTGRLLKRSLQTEDEDFARCLEVVHFRSEDAAAMTEFLASPCVVATGSDETIEVVRSRLRPSQRFVGYAHKFSFAVFGPEIHRSPSVRDDLLEGLALDIARWDQSGCLSPAVVYLVGLPIEDRMSFAEGLASALERIGQDLPRGPLPPAERAAHATERAEAKMRAASHASAAVFEGADSTVILESDARPRPARLGRMIRLHPVPSLDELSRALVPLSAHLSSVALAGFSDREDSQLRFLLENVGVSRMTTPGRLQTPPIDWPHDGLTPIHPTARFIQSEI